MTEPRSLVIEVIERASTLHDRMTSAFVRRHPESPAQVDALADAWCLVATKGDAARFDQRLSIDGLDRARMRDALGPVRLASGERIPEWARLLERYIASLARSRFVPRAPESCTEAQSMNRDGDVPFIELFAELVELADAELAALAGAALAQISTAAHEALRASLAHRLARLAAPLLYEGFERHRSARSPALEHAPPLADARPAPSRRIYDDYVRRMLDGGMLELFREYPVLARLMATATLLWRDATAALLEQLAGDRDAISDHFAEGRALGDVVALHPGLSDPHGGGRTVHVVTFASGLRLVYKPRGLGIDAAFHELLRWLTARGAPLAAPSRATLTPRVLDRSDHGWAEYLEHRECRDQIAVRHYYQYSGALLCLLHSLGSTDCHYENIMAAGEVPVLIDLETLLQPEIERAEPPVDRARNIGGRRLYDDSVLRTGMLPIWQAAQDDTTYDIGGLSACAGQMTPFITAAWERINTDAMRLAFRHTELGPRPNMPLLGGAVVPPAGHVEDIVAGFSAMYEWIAAHADSLLAPDGPVVGLSREQLRFIARPSSVYDHVLRRSLRSDVLRDGAARSVELDLLARGLLPLAPPLWPLLREEQRALQQLDIPIFRVRGDSTAVALDGREDRGSDGARLPVARSGLDVARSRFAAISPGDMARQLQVIRGSFALRYSCDEAVAEPSGILAGACRENAAPAIFGRSELLAAACEIAGEIERLTLTDSDGHVVWITIEPISTTGRGRLQATGYGLYDGLAGIAVFLAAAARCGGSVAHATLARRALLPLRERLRSSRPTFVDEFGIGGACGAASAAYALLLAGRLLDDETLVGDALCAAEQITPAAIAADRSHDVLYGTAGAILALLALHRVYPAPWLLERALTGGSHLLANRRAAPDSAESGHHAWRTACEQMLVGFAHGAAGIAYALTRLHAASGRADLREAALAAVRYEDSLFDQERNEWPDLRTPRRPKPAGSVGATWCHGAAGIGLARLGSLDVCDVPDLRLGLERAIVAIDPTDVAPPPSPDHLCCGSFGAIELLLATGLQRSEPALVTAAHARASAVVRRRQAVGSYRLVASPVAGAYDPALYRGTAGIGYGLLRLCHPEMLPSLLLWE